MPVILLSPAKSLDLEQLPSKFASLSATQPLFKDATDRFGMSYLKRGREVDKPKKNLRFVVEIVRSVFPQKKNVQNFGRFRKPDLDVVGSKGKQSGIRVPI